MQQTFPCPKCSSHNVIGSPSCQGCGENFKYTCPQCGVIVDTKFKSCSECGARLYWPIHDLAEPSPKGKKTTRQEPKSISEDERPEQKSRRPIVIVCLAIVATSLLVAIAMQFLFHGTPFTTPPDASPPAPGQTTATAKAIELSVEELLQAYRTDEKAAEAQYKGKTLRITGVVGSTGKNMVGTSFIKLAGDTIEAWRIQCMFDKEYEDEVAQVTKGQTITVLGECADYHKPDVTIKDCILVH